MGGGPGNCANTAVGAKEIVASVTLTDSVKSVFDTIVFSLVLELRLENRHRFVLRHPLRRPDVVCQVRGLMH